jgi:uncharacterized protein (TIGR02611 family)
MNPHRPFVVRVLIVVAGFLLLAAGALLLVLPGPGLLVIAAGLGLLALEFRWAASLRDWVLRRTTRVRPKKRSHQVAMVALTVALGVVAATAAIWGLPGL